MADSITRKLLLTEIERRGWQYQEIGRQAHFLKIIHPDGRWEMIRGSCPMRTSAIGLWICQRKDLTLDFVRQYGYEVPAYQLVNSLAEAESFLAKHGTIVVKPADGARTEGVSVNISDSAALRMAYDIALQTSGHQKVIVQKHLTGNLYRLLIIDGKLAAAAQRNAAHVIGDGQQTLMTLIEQLNNDPRRSKAADALLKKVDLRFVYDYMGEAALQSVPAEGESVRLSAIDSVSAGGEAKTITNQVHADWERVCGQIAQEAGLFVAGYDVLCDDITQPMHGNQFPLLEINAAPGFRLHEHPTGGGEPEHIAPKLLDAMFPSL